MTANPNAATLTWPNREVAAEVELELEEAAAELPLVLPLDPLEPLAVLLAAEPLPLAVEDDEEPEEPEEAEEEEEDEEEEEEDDWLVYVKKSS